LSSIKLVVRFFPITVIGKLEPFDILTDPQIKLNWWYSKKIIISSYIYTL
jgi:hypothetical protein